MKYHPHGSVLFVTLSVEEGLLLLANPLCEAIIKSCLARAQHLHDVKICHLIVEATHIHIFLVVVNPSDVPGFIGRFKTESAHMLNRVLGRRKRTVWCDGYDSPIVLTPTRAIIAIAYLYANPGKDNLEDTIDLYPGFSSWKMFRANERTRLWRRIQRTAFRALPRDSHNLRGYTKEAERILATSRKNHKFELEPNAWMKALRITDPEEQARVNDRIVERVRRLESRARTKRVQERKRVMGRERLISQPLDIHYRPRRSGRRTSVLTEVRSLRIEFIRFLKQLMDQARRVYQRWKVGDFSEPYPLGLYPPSMPKLAEPLGVPGVS